ncbi:MAG: right-handed parallel beta-helix repeat-containing protein [Candidatus Methylacidiphilales bacterium]|nr:right-handed parallel beta-helix repeat-containing protein [Candidatus Methylacidiphilales bacterium]
MPRPVHLNYSLRLCDFLRWVAVCCVVVSSVLHPGSAQAARDWFIKANSPDDADGTIAKPYKDIYWALEQAKDGDFIHIAAGTYTGRLDTANWTLDTPRLRILGGYNADFTERAPWKYVTRFAFQPGSKARNTGTMLIGGRDHTGCVVDGIVFDQQNRNVYSGAEPLSNLDVQRSSRDPVISLSSPEVEIRNCLVLNGSGTGVILAGEGCRFENNVVMNMAGYHLLEIRGSEQQKPTVITGNSFMFCWSTSAGKSEDGSAGLKLWGGTKADITNNIFLMCDGVAVEVDTKSDRVTLKDNVFCLNGTAHIRYSSDGRDVSLTSANFGDIKDLGFISSENNKVVEPELQEVDRAWMERAINRGAEITAGKIKPEEWAKFRLAMGLTAPADGKGAQGFAMAYDPQQAVKMTWKGPTGSKSTSFPVQFVAPLVRTYWTISYDIFLSQAQALGNKDVALYATLGREVKQYPFGGITEKDFRAFELIPSPLGALDSPPLVFIRRGSPAEATLTQTLALQPPPSNATREFLFRGAVRWEENVAIQRKCALVLDDLIAPALDRPTGRDWFVRGGSQGGNGSKDKPFGDPQEAIRMSLPGDVIHVAAGEYLRPGNRGGWTVDIPNLTLRGGYNSEFTERIPWRFVSKLGVAAGPQAGSIIRGEEDHSGLILDGFVFDGRDMNQYDGNGNLLPDRSPQQPLVSLTSRGCMVRNCLLVNGSLGSVTLSDGGVIENCVILNFHWQSVQLICTGAARRTFLLRQNTLLASWYDRQGGPGGTPDGAGVVTRGDVSLELDGNILGYQDSVGVYCGSPPGRVRMTNNLFSRNLFGHYTDAQRTFLDDDNLAAQVGYAGFSWAAGNLVGDPPLPWDKDWLTAWISRAARVSRRGSEDDWRKFREANGIKAEDVQGVATSGAPVYARAYDWRNARVFFQPPNGEVHPGARAVPISVHFLGIPAAAPRPARTYQPTEVAALQATASSPEGLDAKAIEITGFLSETTTQQVPTDLIEETKVGTWTAVEIHSPQRNDPALLAVVKSDNRLSRILKFADRGTRYVLRGVARKSGRLGRAVLVLDSMEKELPPQPAAAAAAPAPAPTTAPAASPATPAAAPAPAAPQPAAGQPAATTPPAQPPVAAQPQPQPVPVPPAGAATAPPSPPTTPAAPVSAPAPAIPAPAPAPAPSTAPSAAPTTPAPANPPAAPATNAGPAPASSAPVPGASQPQGVVDPQVTG